MSVAAEASVPTVAGGAAEQGRKAWFACGWVKERWGLDAVAATAENGTLYYIVGEELYARGPPSEYCSTQCLGEYLGRADEIASIFVLSATKEELAAAAEAAKEEERAAVKKAYARAATQGAAAVAAMDMAMIPSTGGKSDRDAEHRYKRLCRLRYKAYTAWIWPSVDVNGGDWEDAEFLVEQHDPAEIRSVFKLLKEVPAYLQTVQERVDAQRFHLEQRGVRVSYW